MKSIRLIFVFIIALVFLLGLQFVWLYNTYQLENEKTLQTIDATLIDACNQEMADRINALDSVFKSQGIDSLSFSSISFSVDSAFLDQQKVVPMEFLVMQHVLDAECHFPLNLQALNTIYASFLDERNVHVKFNIQYLDSLGQVAGETLPGLSNGYKTHIIPIVRSEKLQVIADVRPPAVFRNMGGVLLVSVVIVCLIVGCLLYATRTFITQQHLNKLRDNFVYALTHDMKTPLGTIHTVLDQSAKGILDAHPEMKSKFTRVATDQVLNLQALVNQILTVAYVEKGKLSLHKQPVDVKDMIESLISKFSVGQNKKVSFSTHYELNDETLYADPLYLGNAISNLIDNAIKYSGDSVEITLSATAKGQQIYIRVKDNAMGISERDQKNIFNRFERGAEIKRNSASGFGIGLNYVKSVVEAHGGGITLSSKEGIGSDFVITLPLSES